MNRSLLFLMVCLSLLLPLESRAKDNYDSECIIGYKLDWAGIKRPERGQLFNFYPPLDRYFWQGKVIPDFARYVERYGPLIFDLPQVESFLPKEIYFRVTKKSYCSKKEELTKQYYDFWQSRGLTLPHIERIPDPIKSFAPEEIKARAQVMKDIVKGLPEKPYSQCILAVKFDWAGAPLDQLNKSIANYPRRSERGWEDREIPEFVLAIESIQSGMLYDENRGITRMFYNVRWDYCYKKNILWEDYIAYIRAQYAWVPKYEVLADERAQGQFKAANIVKAYKEEKQRNGSWKRPAPVGLPPRKTQSEEMLNYCVIAYDYDWSGLRGEKLATDLKLYNTQESQREMWGENVPDFARYVVKYSFGEKGKHRDDRALPTRIYYWVDMKQCSNKAVLAQQYMEFWRSKGVRLPAEKRVLYSE